MIKYPECEDRCETHHGTLEVIGTIQDDCKTTEVYRNRIWQLITVTLSAIGD